MPDLAAPISIVRDTVARALAEDLTPLGDITSSLLPPDVQGTGTLIAHSEGVMAGSTAAIETFLQVDEKINVDWRVQDGTDVGVDDVLGIVDGPVASLLAAERTARNFVSRLSGIATMTRRYVRAGQNKTRIRDSRLTTPGMRTLEKAAIRAGGGVNHRGSLSDGILLRDKHLAHVSITDAIRRARLRWPGRFVEVECRTVDQVAEALDSKPDMIMLDGVTSDFAKEVVDLISGACPVEVFGAIDIRTVGEYVNAGVEFLSVTSLTQAANAFEIGFEVKAK